MKQQTLLKLASQSILKNKMRTLLTMLGIVIGVGAVIVMVAIGNGAQARIQEQINSLGTNVIMIMPGSTQQGGASQGAGTFNRLTVDDADKVKREATTLAAVSPVIQTRTQVIGGNGNWRTQINGVSTDGHVPFQIIGVLAKKGQNAAGNDQDDVVLVPYTTAQARLSGFVRLGQILASTYSSSDIPAAQDEIKGIMRESHKLGDSADDDFTIRNQNELADAASSTTKVMTYLLAAIASVSLVVGGIGIMNIMLVSVTERTREIGIRMAIGARGSDVLTQFLVESIVMSVAGGIIGLLVGFGGAALLGHLTGWSTSTPPIAVAIAVGFSAAVGMFFGYYPARKAAALNPIQALRYE